MAGPVGGAGARAGARPLSVSCETCKLRKVKCDRGQPSCGWCMKNGQMCEYKERKKPGLRAGYGRELESKLSEQAAMLSACLLVVGSWLTSGRSYQGGARPARFGDIPTARRQPECNRGTDVCQFRADGVPQPVVSNGPGSTSC